VASPSSRLATSLLATWAVGVVLFVAGQGGGLVLIAVGGLGLPVLVAVVRRRRGLATVQEAIAELFPWLGR
jgi:hypothetical protein